MARTQKSTKITVNMTTEQIRARLNRHPVWVPQWNRYACHSELTHKVFVSATYYGCQRLARVCWDRKHMAARLPAELLPRYHGVTLLF
jgi:uncharacterized protein VirK/YbjX